MVGLLLLFLTSQAAERDAGLLLSNRLLEAVNQVREERGIPLLVGSPSLMLAAQEHSEEMVDLNYFSHTSPIPERRRISQRVILAGLKIQRLNQRIFATHGLPDEELVDHYLDLWLHENKYSKKLFSTDYTHVGYGAQRKGDEVFLTQILGGGPHWAVDTNGKVVAGAPSPEQCRILAEKVLRLSNEVRESLGASFLEEDSRLSAAALGHSNEMLSLNYFAHRSPTPGKETNRKRINAQGINPVAVSENIFQCTGYTPESVPDRAIRAWLESTGHRENILRRGTKATGVGVAGKGDRISVTQVFSGDS